MSKITNYAAIVHNMYIHFYITLKQIKLLIFQFLTYQDSAFLWYKLIICKPTKQLEKILPGVKKIYNFNSFQMAKAEITV